MDDHFSDILGTRLAAPALPQGFFDSGATVPSSSQPSSSSSTAIPFIPSSSYIGRKEGYVFKKGSHGVGYYIDAALNGGDANGSGSVKRKRDDNAPHGRTLHSSSSSFSNKFSDASAKALSLLEEAEQNAGSGGGQLTTQSVQTLLLSFEAKINNNQMLRMKHEKEPSKFMDSEIELAAEINSLLALTASPDLYPTFVKAGGVGFVLMVLMHDNADISLAAINLLAQLVDSKTILEAADDDDGGGGLAIVDALIGEGALELLVQNLSRLNEYESDDDAQGVYNTMNVLENLVELDESAAVLVSEKTPILSYLLARLKNKSFDANKLFCSEMLSILLQAGTEVPAKLLSLRGADGLNDLLEAIDVYRRIDPAESEEHECVENLFLSLCAVLLSSEGQARFVECEGFDLVVRCLAEQRFAAICSVKAVSYAVLNSRAACEALVRAGGLKYLFPILMGKGLPKLPRKSSAKYTRKDVEEGIITIVSQFVVYLFDCKTDDISGRLLAKFLENSNEKLDRCLELYLKYRKQLAMTELAIQETVASLEAEGNLDELAEYSSDESVYLQRLEGGLYQLQQLAMIITFVVVFNDGSFAGAAAKLGSEDGDMEEVLTVLREAAAEYKSDGSEANQKATLIAWSAALATKLIGDSGGDVKS